MAHVARDVDQYYVVMQMSLAFTGACHHASCGLFLQHFLHCSCRLGQYADVYYHEILTSSPPEFEFEKTETLEVLFLGHNFHTMTLC